MRFRVGLTQSELGASIGLSQPQISRLELGHGAGAPLATWVAAAESVGLGLGTTTPNSEPFGIAAILGLAGEGGWSLFGARTDATEASTSGWGSFVQLQRGPRLRRFNQHAVMASGELLVVCVADVVTDAQGLIASLRDAVDAAWVVAPIGWRVGGLLVVRRTMANRRRLTECRAVVDVTFPESGSHWLGTLRFEASTMPDLLGFVWMDHRAMRLIPTRLRLRCA